MDLFNIQRFSFVLRDEVLTGLISLIRTTFAGLMLAFVIYGVFIYTSLAANISNFSEFDPVLFDIILVVGGMIFTSIIFRDLHTNLENIHYLMLPASTLEKMLVRYILSGPVFVIYVIVIYTIFEFIARTVLNMALGISVNYVDWTEAWVWKSSISYLGLHACCFLGAVMFKKSNLVRTMIYAFAIFALIAFLYWVVVLIKYSEFTDHWYGGFNASNILVFVKLESNRWFEMFVGFAISVWLLFIAYLWVRDYEV